jgi:hypothetical protein
MAAVAGMGLGHRPQSRAYPGTQGTLRGIPESVFVEFSEQAGREFGFTHGAKKQLFLKMWKAYKAQSLKA